MPLHPVLAEKLQIATRVSPARALTRRDARLPEIAGKVHSVIGMRRAGKTTFLQQLHDGWRASLPPERVLYLGFDDDRLAGIGVEQLGFLLEEFYRLHPELRGRERVHWYLDEIQLVPGWERFVRRVLDTEKVEVVVSGSSTRAADRTSGARWRPPCCWSSNGAARRWATRRPTPGWRSTFWRGIRAPERN